ncbi:hypothetical protein [uncultured Cohaesibacter sp.]|uniref:hypothetical protein n=1 Tax=uncultured Cohaesibacter sp. TaxID=1002546 RepID=UPI002AAAB99B|nr:hypothetical protein [uncultured Cohaesibacter sp.]
MTTNARNTVSPSLLTRLIPKTGHGWMMAICCTLMVASAASIFMDSGNDSSSSNRLLALLPIIGCLVMHFVMHRFMGDHCDHAKTHTSDQGKSGH